MPAKKTTTNSIAVKKAAPAKKTVATAPLKKGNIKPLKPTS